MKYITIKMSMVLISLLITGIAHGYSYKFVNGTPGPIRLRVKMSVDSTWYYAELKPNTTNDLKNPSPEATYTFDFVQKHYYPLTTQAASLPMPAPGAAMQKAMADGQWAYGKEGLLALTVEAASKPKPTTQADIDKAIANKQWEYVGDQKYGYCLSQMQVAAHHLENGKWVPSTQWIDSAPSYYGQAVNANNFKYNAYDKIISDANAYLMYWHQGGATMQAKMKALAQSMQTTNKESGIASQGEGGIIGTYSLCRDYDGSPGYGLFVIIPNLDPATGNQLQTYTFATSK